MVCKEMNIDLYKHNIPYNNGSNDKPQVVSYLTPIWYKLPAIIVLPGGAYTSHVEHEAETIAEYYRSKGILREFEL